MRKSPSSDKAFDQAEIIIRLKKSFSLNVLMLINTWL